MQYIYTLRNLPPVFPNCTKMLDMLPKWVNALFSEKFFEGCLVHENKKKNEKNIHCLDCCLGICAHCVLDHQSHRLLQVRRYIYNDVLRVDDAAKFIDCSYIQPYTTNKHKVLFIKERPQTHSCRSSRNFCTSCDRALQEPYLYCCLSCKVSHILKMEGRLTKEHVFEYEGVAFPKPGFNNCLMTPDSVLEPAGSNRSESSSSANGCILACKATAETVVRKKRSNIPPYRAACRPAVVSSVTAGIGSGRRKSTPHRSPLY